MSQDKLDRLTDALVENILSTSDEDILAEAREDAPDLFQMLRDAPLAATITGAAGSTIMSLVSGGGPASPAASTNQRKSE